MISILKGGLFLSSAFLLPAQLIFTHTKINSDVPIDAENHTVSIPFTAKGDVSLSKINEKCSCMKGRFSSEKASWIDGETGTFELTLDTSLIKGRSTKSVDLTFSTHPLQTITIDTHIPIALTSDVKTHKWKIGQESEHKEYHIKIAPSFDIEIVTVSRSNTAFEFELSPPKRAEDGSLLYTLSVSPNDFSSNAFCLFRLETNSQIERYKSFSLMALIQE